MPAVAVDPDQWARRRPFFSRFDREASETMKRIVAWAARAAGLGEGLDALYEVREALRTVPEQPAQWDEAAVQLHKLRSEARRIGYPWYLYGLLCAARTAQACGAMEFTAIEFGVAGGNGLVAMEEHAKLVERQWGVSIRIVGFDMSSGLPPRADPRDCPFAFRGGEFKMDVDKLRRRLHRAELRLGDVAETVPQFIAERHAPIGFVSNDLDLYTSTRDSFALFSLGTDRLLPRVTLYFDDLFGYPYTSANGEWAAIEEFNQSQAIRRLGHVRGLKHRLGLAYRFSAWNESFFVLHAFDHPKYAAGEVTAQPETALRRSPSSR